MPRGRVSLDGDTALVGGRSDADAFLLEGGSALVLARSGETWQLEAKLVPSDQAPLWYFPRGRAKPCTPD